jgi:hypothetical protein
MCAHAYTRWKIALKEKCMRRLSALLVVCGILGATTGFAYAGACADQITQLRQATQLGNQSVPESAWQGRTYARLMFSADLALAEAQAAEGNEHECLLAARRAGHRLER